MFHTDSAHGQADWRGVGCREHYQGVLPKRAPTSGYLAHREEWPAETLVASQGLQTLRATHTGAQGQLSDLVRSAYQEGFDAVCYPQDSGAKASYSGPISVHSTQNSPREERSIHSLPSPREGRKTSISSVASNSSPVGDFTFNKPSPVRPISASTRSISSPLGFTLDNPTSELQSPKMQRSMTTHDTSPSPREPRRSQTEKIDLSKPALLELQNPVEITVEIDGPLSDSSAQSSEVSKLDSSKLATISESVHTARPTQTTQPEILTQAVNLIETTSLTGPSISSDSSQENKPTVAIDPPVVAPVQSSPDPTALPEPSSSPKASTLDSTLPKATDSSALHNPGDPSLLVPPRLTPPQTPGPESTPTIISPQDNNTPPHSSRSPQSPRSPDATRAPETISILSPTFPAPSLEGTLSLFPPYVRSQGSESDPNTGHALTSSSTYVSSNFSQLAPRFSPSDTSGGFTRDPDLTTDIRQTLSSRVLSGRSLGSGGWEEVSSSTSVRFHPESFSQTSDAFHSAYCIDQDPAQATGRAARSHARPPIDSNIFSQGPVPDSPSSFHSSDMSCSAFEDTKGQFLSGKKLPGPNFKVPTPGHACQEPAASVHTSPSHLSGARFKTQRPVSAAPLRNKHFHYSDSKLSAPGSGGPYVYNPTRESVERIYGARPAWNNPTPNKESGRVGGGDSGVGPHPAAPSPYSQPPGPRPPPPRPVAGIRIRPQSAHPYQSTGEHREISAQERSDAFNATVLNARLQGSPYQAVKFASRSGNVSLKSPQRVPVCTSPGGGGGFSGSSPPSHPASTRPPSASTQGGGKRRHSARSRQHSLNLKQMRPQSSPSKLPAKRRSSLEDGGGGGCNNMGRSDTPPGEPYSESGARTARSPPTRARSSYRDDVKSAVPVRPASAVPARSNNSRHLESQASRAVRAAAVHAEKLAEARRRGSDGGKLVGDRALQAAQEHSRRRALTKSRKEQFEKAKRESAILYLQAHIRGYLARSAYRPQRALSHYAASRVQALWHGHMVREEVRAQQKAAIKLQASARGHQQRQHFAAMRREREVAATRVQSRYRTYHSQKIYSQQRNAATKMQSTIRGHLARHQARARRDSVLSIQRHYRGHAGRQAAKREREAAIRRREQERLEAVLIIQAHQRGVASREAMRARGSAATVIQTIWRGWSGRKQASQLRRELAASTKIQAYERGRATRVAYAKAREDHYKAKKQDAATRIQAVYRGKRDRILVSEIQKEKNRLRQIEEKKFKNRISKMFNIAPSKKEQKATSDHSQRKKAGIDYSSRGRQNKIK